MKNKTLFIGVGAMGGAILRGALQSGVLKASDVYITERTEIKANALQKELGVNASTQLPNLEEIGLIVLGVKPQVLPQVLANLKGVNPDTKLVSIAAGIGLDQLNSQIESSFWYRAMPNIGVSVGAGFTAITAQDQGDVPTIVQDLFANIGEVVVVSEMDLERIGSVCGAGIGFAFVIMDALADAGVQIGMSRPLAIKAAAQALAGAGILATATGEHPAVLRDKVTSPGGTTIAGISAMEKYGVRTAMKEAVFASFNKAAELGRQDEKQQRKNNSLLPIFR